MSWNRFFGAGSYFRIRSFALFPDQQLLPLSDIPRLFKGTAKTELSREAASRHLFQSMFYRCYLRKYCKIETGFLNIELDMLRVNSVSTDGL